MSDYFWSDEAAETVRRRWADGASAGFIARELGLTRNQIIGKVHRMKLPKRPIDSQARYLRLRTRRGPSRKRKAPQPPVVAVEVETIPSEPILFIDRRFDQCAFIADDPKTGAQAPQILCCGAKTVRESSWCSYHFRIVYAPDRPRRGRPPAYTVKHSVQEWEAA